MLQYLRQTVGAEIKNAVIVSPDAGGAKRFVTLPSLPLSLLPEFPSFSASSMAAALDLDFALFHKERKKANEIARMVLVGNVENKVAILVDDMADTCGTLALAAKHLLAGGAKSVLALVTHGILSGPALRVLGESEIEKLIVTNSIPQRLHKEGCDKVREIDISHVLAEAVRRSHYGESVSALFTTVPWAEVSHLLTSRESWTNGLHSLVQGRTDRLCSITRRFVPPFPPPVPSFLAHSLDGRGRRSSEDVGWTRWRTTRCSSSTVGGGGREFKKDLVDLESHWTRVL